MTPRKSRPPRKWDIDDLLDLGVKEGVKANYLKAVPILILEIWVNGGREEGVANYVRTKDIASRLVESGLVLPFKPKGSAVVLASLTTIQGSRNLTRPPLIKYEDGMFWINLPHYELLLQEYYRKYREDYTEDYKKLFPKEEPKWESSGQSDVRAGPEESDSMIIVPEAQDDIRNLLTLIEQALRDRQQSLERLVKENQNLHAKLAALQERQRVPYRGILDDELRNECSEFLMRENTFPDAIIRAGRVLEERLRKTIGGDGSEMLKNGVDLVDYALSPDHGKLIISDHPAEQDGVRMLFRGVVLFIRNPPSHKKMRYTEVEAVQAIGLIDYLLFLLQQVRKR